MVSHLISIWQFLIAVVSEGLLNIGILFSKLKHSSNALGFIAGNLENFGLFAIEILLFPVDYFKINFECIQIGRFMSPSVVRRSYISFLNLNFKATLLTDRDESAPFDRWLIADLNKFLNLNTLYNPVQK